eukprot:74275-Chlamydomonas_euryale.AAC.1
MQQAVEAEVAGAGAAGRGGAARRGGAAIGGHAAAKRPVHGRGLGDARRARVAEFAAKARARRLRVCVCAQGQQVGDVKQGAGWGGVEDHGCSTLIRLRSALGDTRALFICHVLAHGTFM